MRVLWPLAKDLGFQYLMPRRFTQDPLENTIGAIRDNCGNNRMPTVPQFQSSFTSLILHNLEDKGKCNRNCELDDNMLSPITEFFRRDLLKVG